MAWYDQLIGIYSPAVRTLRLPIPIRATPIAVLRVNHDISFFLSCSHARYHVSHKSVLSGIVVDRGGHRNADALGCRNSGDRHVIDIHVDLDLRQKSKEAWMYRQHWVWKFQKLSKSQPCLNTKVVTPVFVSSTLPYCPVVPAISVHARGLDYIWSILRPLARVAVYRCANRSSDVRRHGKVS